MLTEHFVILEKYYNELGNKYNRDKCNGISCRISGSNVIGSRSIDQGSECGGRCHTAGERTKIVKQAELENVLGKQETDNHGNYGHKYAVEEILHVKHFKESVTAGNTCAGKEKKQSKLFEYLQGARDRGFGKAHNGKQARYRKKPRGNGVLPQA